MSFFPVFFKAQISMLCRPRPSHAKPWICRHFCQWFFRFISNFISTVKFHSVRQFQSFCNFSSRCNNNTWFFLSGFYMIRTEVCRASCMRPCTAVPTRSKGGLSYDEICFRMEAGAFQRRSRCPAGSSGWTGCSTKFCRGELARPRRLNRDWPWGRPRCASKLAPTAG